MLLSASSVISFLWRRLGPIPESHSDTESILLIRRLRSSRLPDKSAIMFGDGP